MVGAQWMSRCGGLQGNALSFSLASSFWGSATGVIDAPRHTHTVWFAYEALRTRDQNGLQFHEVFCGKINENKHNNSVHTGFKLAGQTVGSCSAAVFKNKHAGARASRRRRGGG